VGEQVELGIDLEEMRPLPDMSRLALEIMSAAELDRFWAIPPAGRRRAFYTAWTLKEAYLKAVSVGLGRPPCEVEVDLRTVRRPMLLAVAGDRAEAARWSVTPLRAADGFVGVLLHTSTASQHKWQEEQR
jgi:4'-phosphopantetheinyl transferase